MAEASLQRAKAEVDYLEGEQERTVIRAPISGKVLTPRFRERLYESVQAGDRVCEIADARAVRVEALVPERFADVIDIGQPVVVKVHSYPLKPFHGEVLFISPAVEERDGLRFLRVETEIANEEGLLLPRMRGYAQINTGRRSLLTLGLRRVVRWIRVRFLI